MTKVLEILVIEDDVDVCLEFKKLETKLIKIKVVSSGVEAYKILYKTSPDFQFDYIITSIGLPDENGVEIVKFAKTIFTSKIIIYTNKNYYFFKDFCQFDYYYNKQKFSPEDIINIILKEYYF